MDRPVGSGYGSGLYILTRRYIIMYIYIYITLIDGTALLSSELFRSHVFPTQIMTGRDTLTNKHGGKHITQIPSGKLT